MDPIERLRKVAAILQKEVEILEVQATIQSRAKEEMSKAQREYFLREQLRQIQSELGGGAGKSDNDALRAQIESARMPPEARAEADRQLRRLEQANPDSAEAGVLRTYLEWLVELPWVVATDDKLDLAEARAILDEDHYGLDDVKDRILEHLGVLKLTRERGRVEKGPILCFVGPPGVGKTSLGRSIARALGRKFVRMSLGGVRDEAEIRGHRRTYVGAMPGRVIQGMKSAGTINPVFVLDEIDKLGADFRGDPSSALLEVLDPEQNSTFNDHYLEVDYDLSDVMFVTTANTLRMPQPLLDRMEVIRIPGYTEDEKVEIAKRHLLPKQIKEHGLKKNEWAISDDAMKDLIRYYTREAGVRNLERELANLARKAVKEILMKDLKKVTVTRRNLAKYAGVRRYRYGEVETEDLVGITTGLAWTEVGGEILQIEAVTLPGKGRVITTGKLGDVMRESVQAAESYVKSRAIAFGIKPTLFEKRDIHVHVPEGATPKDGPSAGIAMFTSIVSVLTGIPVRRDVAMTGEITLRGRVLPIGGLKEKLLAALRAGTKTVLIPSENEKDLADIPDNVKRELKIIPVSNADEVLRNALTREPIPIEWTEPDEVRKIPTDDADDSRGGIVTH
jgi:ATP-dependent Lon protease